jgi:toxoflavin synthase
MMKMGQEIEERLGRGANQTLKWFEADVSSLEDMAGLPLRYKEQGYDIVMANWLFQHAGSDEVLDRMMKSCVAYLKPGGLFIGTRLLNHGARAPAWMDGKYGISVKNLVDIPGGAAFQLVIHVDPPSEIEGASLDLSSDLSKIPEFNSRYGLEDTEVQPLGCASWIKSDPGYWKLLTENPGFAVVKAKKAVRN